MITVPNLNILNNLPNTASDGEYALVEDTNKVYKYSDENGWEEASGEASLGVSLYEINQAAISQLPGLVETEINESKNLINQYITISDNTYYMLYGLDASYFTLFKVKDTNNPEHISDIVIECLETLGTIQSISMTTDNQAVECWVKTRNDDCYALFLFAYDGGLIECSM